MLYSLKYTPPHCFFCNFAGWVTALFRDSKKSKTEQKWKNIRLNCKLNYPVVNISEEVRKLIILQMFLQWRVFFRSHTHVFFVQFQTDRHVNVEDDFSDYDSSASNNGDGEIDVKEALRSSINLKSKYQKSKITVFFPQPANLLQKSNMGECFLT